MSGYIITLNITDTAQMKMAQSVMMLSYLHQNKFGTNKS